MRRFRPPSLGFGGGDSVSESASPSIDNANGGPTSSSDLAVQYRPSVVTAAVSASSPMRQRAAKPSSILVVARTRGQPSITSAAASAFSSSTSTHQRVAGRRRRVRDLPLGEAQGGRDRLHVLWLRRRLGREAGEAQDAVFHVRVDRELGAAQREGAAVSTVIERLGRRPTTPDVGRGAQGPRLALSYRRNPNVEQSLPVANGRQQMTF